MREPETEHNTTVTVNCNCCQREVNNVRSSLWHYPDAICNECFHEWYDGNRPTYQTDDSNKLAIGNWIRKKHNLPPLKETIPC